MVGHDGETLIEQVWLKAAEVASLGPPVADPCALSDGKQRSRTVLDRPGPESGEGGI